MPALLEITPCGLYCSRGGFYVDPWEPVARAVITHAHGDHARPGSRDYLTVSSGAELLRQRVGPDAQIEPIEYGQRLDHNGVQISLHPAGHILGSAQVRLEYEGQVWVVSGDCKVSGDSTCQSFEPLHCHTFVTESTFALPIYRWPTADQVFADINAWWKQNQECGRTSLIYAYALGKSQRVLTGLDESLGPILVHGAVDRFLPAYRAQGVRLPVTERATTENARATRGHAIVIAPPSSAGTPWMRKFGPVSTAMASGWMQIRGTRRRRAIDRGFVLSDHADWAGLLGAIQATGAEKVWVTHGYRGVMVRWLTDAGVAAEAVATKFEGELDEDPQFENSPNQPE